MCADFVRRGSKIIAVGSNYLSPVRKLLSLRSSKPSLFLKPTTSYKTSPADLDLPSSKFVKHEIALGVVMRLPGCNIKRAGVDGYIAGYALGLDLTAEGLTEAEKAKRDPWTASKSFECFTPISQFIPKELVADPHNPRLWSSINAELRQNDSTANIIVKIPELIEYISSAIPLQAGDLILTGSPKGASVLEGGDMITSGLEQNGKKLASLKFKVHQSNGGTLLFADAIGLLSAFIR